MINIKPNYESSKIKEKLASALGNTIKIVKILKEAMLCDSVDLLIYDKSHKNFYDKINKNTISIRFLESDTVSMIGKAYTSKTPYSSSHTLYDEYYNVSIDNPFKLVVSAQIIIPIINEDVVIGMIRFSKSKFTFHQDILDKIIELHGSFSDIFSSQIDEELEKLNETFFSLRKDDVCETIDRLKENTKKLYENTYNPEIKKLISKIEVSIESLCDYTSFNAKNIILQDKNIIESSSKRVLIADDVKMNVKILHAMIKGESSLDIHFAYDGVETLEKIAQANRDKKGIDILFLDHYMPGKLGLEIAQSIREYENINKNFKTIIISITNDPAAIEAQKHLYDYHISKPFSRLDITTVMSQIERL